MKLPADSSAFAVPQLLNIWSQADEYTDLAMNEASGLCRSAGKPAGWVRANPNPNSFQISSQSQENLTIYGASEPIEGIPPMPSAIRSI
jgi:hypothetical protein